MGATLQIAYALCERIANSRPHNGLANGRTCQVAYRARAGVDPGGYKIELIQRPE